MSQQANRRYLSNTYYRPLVIVGSVVVSLLLANWLLRPSLSPTLLVLSLCLFAALVLIGRFVWHRRMQRAFVHPDPQAAIDLFATPFRDNAGSEHFYYYLTGTISALYGRYGDTRRALAAYAWDTAVPMNKALGLLLEATLAYLDTKTYIEGYQYAKQARQLSELLGHSLGRRSYVQTYAIYVHIGAILTNDAVETHLAALQTCFQETNGYVKLLAAWGLGMGHHSQKHYDSCATMRHYLHTYAPHCSGLTLPTD
jgi:hypothetical protein